MGTEQENPGDHAREPAIPVLPVDPGGGSNQPPTGDPPQPVGIEPTFTISYQPDTGTPPPAGQSDDNGTPTNTALRVSLSSLAATENALMLTTQDLVGKYEQLRAMVAAQQDTVFGQTLTHEEDEMIDSGQATRWQHVVLDDPLHDAAVEFANLIKPYMAQALRDFALTMQLFGAHIQAYEATGDAYATADNNSRFDPGE